MTAVRTPFAGPVVALADVPDPVFAGQLVGAGVAVDPSGVEGAVTAVAPVDGTIVKLHPHAFALQGSAGTDVLVHVGIDTVKLKARASSCSRPRATPCTPGTPSCGSPRA